MGLQSGICVLVGVIGLSELSKSLLDVVVRCIPLNVEDRVV